MAFLCLRNLWQHDIAIPWAVSVAAWCPGGGDGHRDDGDGDGDGGSSGGSRDSDARGRTAKAGRCDTEKARVYASDNAGTSTTAE